MRRPLLAALGLAAASGAAAQDVVTPGSPLFTAGISQGFTVDSNYRLDDPNPGTSYYADTRVQLGLLSETQLQTLALGIDTGLRALWEAERDFDLTFASPSTATGDYLREWASGSIDVGLRYRQTDVDADRPLADFIDPDTGEIDVPDDLDQLSQDITERRYDATVDLALAQDSPSSYEFSVAATRFDYDEVTNDTTPRDNLTGDALWRLRLTPVLSGAVLASYRYFEADDERNTLVRDADIDVGVIYEPDEVLRLDFGLGYAKYQRRETEGPEGDRRRETIDETGPVVRAAVRYQFEEITLNALARYSNATDGAPFTGNLRATYPLPNGRLTGRIFQNKTGSSTGNQVRVTGAGIGLLHEINQVSALQLDATAARQVDETAPFRADTTRVSVSAIYSRDITDTVSASLGYRFRSYDREPEEATSNAVFVEIGKSFSSRP
ncbi:hypothetical protein [Amaricoccus sp.]|uniref:hypothetical protein n=1 Tax=Amaricoccus sp. TaxID=1872485 RepID=UPI001B5946CF|nr:hypothetical protein [Amaricoccus sp.]MBP7003128.1 hypothetical protein [Amaricoccus sp.]